VRVETDLSEKFFKRESAPLNISDRECSHG